MRRLYLPFFVFALSFIYYGYQACPVFYFWDSAELSAAVLGDGVPHPPGFPSLLILAKLWLGIFPLDNAYGLNLLSALFASLGLTFWYLAVDLILQDQFGERKKMERAILSLISTIILGSSFSYTIQAVRFEVYSLNFACFAILLYLGFKLAGDNINNRLIFFIMMIIISAVSLGGHHFTAILSFPGIFLILYLHRSIRLRHILYFAAAALILVIPIYSSIYFLAKKNPILNWGDPSSWRNFADYFLLKEFSTPLSSLAPGHMARNAAFAVELLMRQTGILGLLVGLWGIIRFIRLSPKTVVPLLTILIPNIFSILYFKEYFYENYDQHGYLLFSVALLTLFIAMTIGFLSEYLRGLLCRKIMRKTGMLSVLIPVALAGMIVFTTAEKKLFSADLSRTLAADEFAGLFLSGIPENSVVITSYYNTYFCLLAYNALSRHGKDIVITNVYNWDHEWGRVRTAALLGFDPGRVSKRSDFYRRLLNSTWDRRPVYIEYDDASAPLINYLKPSGLGYIFSVSDTSLAGTVSPAAEIESYSEIAMNCRDIESIRMWVFWFQSRGEFFLKRGQQNIATPYFKAVDLIASLADIR